MHQSTNVVFIFVLHSHSVSSFPHISANYRPVNTMKIQVMLKSCYRDYTTTSITVGFLDKINNSM